MASPADSAAVCHPGKCAASIVDALLWLEHPAAIVCKNLWLLVRAVQTVVNVFHLPAHLYCTTCAHSFEAPSSLYNSQTET